jgi:hypothetical protein
MLKALELEGKDNVLHGEIHSSKIGLHSEMGQKIFGITPVYREEHSISELGAWTVTANESNKLLQSAIQNKTEPILSNQEALKIISDFQVNAANLYHLMRIIHAEARESRQALEDSSKDLSFVLREGLEIVGGDEILRYTKEGQQIKVKESPYLRAKIYFNSKEYLQFDFPLLDKKYSPQIFSSKNIPTELLQTLKERLKNIEDHSKEGLLKSDQLFGELIQPIDSIDPAKLDKYTLKLNALLIGALPSQRQ